MTSTFEKYPCEIKVVKMSTTIIGKELDLYFVSGVMNQNQAETIKERLPVISEFKVDPDMVVLSTLVSHQQLVTAYEKFIPLAKEFRGQYYAVANRFVDACKPYIEG